MSPSGDFKLTRTWIAGVESSLSADSKDKEAKFNDLISKVKRASTPAFNELKEIFKAEYTVEFVKTDLKDEIKATFAKKAGGAPVTHTFKLIDPSAPPSPGIDPELLGTLCDMWNTVMASPALAGASGPAHAEAPLSSSAAALGAASVPDTIDPARLETLTHLNEYLTTEEKSHSEEVQNSFIQKVEKKRFTGSTDTIFKASDLALLGDEKALKLLDISLLEDIRACITDGKFKEAALTITLLDQHNKFAILTSLGMTDSLRACTFSNTDSAFITKLAATLKTPGKHLGIEGLIGSEIARVKDEISELKAQAYVHQMTAGYEREIASYIDRISALQEASILTTAEAGALQKSASSAKKSAAGVAGLREALEEKLREKIQQANLRAEACAEVARSWQAELIANRASLEILRPENAALREELAASEAEVGRLGNALRDAQAATDAAVRETAAIREELATVTRTRDAALAQVAALTAANAEAQRTIDAFPAAQAALRREHDEATEALKAQHAAALEELRRGHAAATDALTAANARALAEAQAGFDRDVAELREAQARELATLGERHRGEIAGLTAAKDAAVARAETAEGKIPKALEVVAKAARTIGKLTADLEASQAQVARLTAEADETARDHAAALAAQTAQHAAALEALRESKDAEKAAALRLVEEAAQRAAEEAAAALTEVRAQLARSHETNKGLRSELAEVTKQLERSVGAIELLQREVERTTADAGSLHEQRGRLIEDLSAKADRLLKDKKITEERKRSLRDAKGTFDAASASLASQEAQLPALLESTKAAFEASNAKEIQVALASASGKAVPKELSAESLERKVALASAQAAYDEAFARIQETRAGLTQRALELSAAMEEVSTASAGDLAIRLEAATSAHAAASSAARDLSSELALAGRENEELAARNSALTADLAHNASELSEASKKLAKQTGIIALQQKTLMRLADENKDLQTKLYLTKWHLATSNKKLEKAHIEFAATLAEKEEAIRDLGERLAANEATLSALREEKGRVDGQLGDLGAEKESNLAKIATLTDESAAQSRQIEALSSEKAALEAQLREKEGKLTLARQETATQLAKINAQGGELARLAKKLESTETARVEASRERDEAKAAIASLKAEFASGIETAQRSFEERLSPLTTRLGKAEEKQRALTAANLELTSRAEAAEARVRELTDANAALEASGAASLVENASLQAALEEATAERNALRGQLAAIKAEIGDAESVSTFVAAQAAAINAEHGASLAERQAAHKEALAEIERTLGERSRAFDAASAKSAATLSDLQAQLSASSEENARQAVALEALAGRSSLLEKELTAFREEFNSLEQKLLGQVATLPTIEARKDRLVAHVRGLDDQIASLKEENEGLRARLALQASEHIDAMAELSSRLTSEKDAAAARALEEIGALTSARDEALESLEASKAEVARMTALNAAKTQRIAGLEAAILLLGSDRKRLQGIQKAQQASLSLAREDRAALEQRHLDAIRAADAKLAAMTEERDSASRALLALRAEFAAATEAFESEQGRLQAEVRAAQAATAAAERQFGIDKAALEARFGEQEAALSAQIAELSESGAARASEAAAQIARMQAELEPLRALKGSVAKLNITDEAGVRSIQEAIAGIKARLSEEGVDVSELNFGDLPSLVNRLGAALIENKAFKARILELEAEIAALTDAHAQEVAALRVEIGTQTTRADAAEAKLAEEKARFSSELAATLEKGRAEVAGLQEELRTLTAAKTEALAEVARLSRDLERQTLANDGLKRAHAEHEAALEADLEARTLEFTSEKARLTQALAAQKLAFEGAISDLESQLEAARGNGAASAREVEAQRTLIAGLQSELAKLKALEAGVKKLNISNPEEALALQSSIAEMQARIDASTEGNAALATKLGTSKTLLVRLTSALAQLSQTNQALKQAIAGLKLKAEADRAAFDADLRELQGKLSAAEEAKRNVSAELEALRASTGASVGVLTAEREAALKGKRAAEKALAEAQASFDAASRQQVAALEEATRTIASLRAELECLTGKTALEYQTIISGLKTHLPGLEATDPSIETIQSLIGAINEQMSAVKLIGIDPTPEKIKGHLEEVAALRALLESVRGANAALGSELAEARAIIARQEEAFRTQGVALKASEAKALRLEGEIAAKKAAHGEEKGRLQADFAAEKARLQEAQRALEAKLEALTEALTGEKAKTAAQALLIEQLQGQLRAKGDVEGALATAVAATEVAQKENADLTASHAAALSALSTRLTGEKTTLEGTLRAEISRLEQQAAAEKASAVAALSALEQERGAKAALQTRFEELGRETSTIARENASFLSQKTAFEAHLQANLKAVIANLIPVNPALKALDVDSLSGDALIDIHRELTGSLFALYAENLATIEAQKSALAEASRLHADLSLQLGEKQGALDAAGRSKGEVDRALGQALAENARLQGVVDGITPQFEASQAEVSRLTEELRSAKTVTAADKAAITRLEGLLEKATAANGALSGEKSRAEAALGEAEATIRSLRETARQREAFIERQEADIARLLTVIGEAAKKTASLKRDLADKEAANVGLSSALAEAQAATRTAQAATSTKEAEISRERAAFGQERDRLLAEQEKALAAMADANAATIARMEAEHQAALGVLRTEHEAALGKALASQQEALRAEFARAMAAREAIHLAAVAEVKAPFTELEAAHRALQATAESSDAEVARLSGDLATLRDVTLPASEAARVAALKEAAGVRSELLREGIKFTAEIGRLTAAIETMTGQKLEALNLNLTASQIRRDLDEIPSLKEGLKAKGAENAALLEKIASLEATATEISKYFEELIIWLNSQDEPVGLGEIVSQMADAKGLSPALDLHKITDFVGKTIEAYSKALSEKQAGLDTLQAEKDTLQREYDELVGALESAEGAVADAEARASAKDPKAMKARISEQLERIRGVNLRIQRQEAEIQRLSTQLPAIERKNATLLRECMEKGRQITDLEAALETAKAECAAALKAKAKTETALALLSAAQDEAVTAFRSSGLAELSAVGGAASLRASPAASYGTSSGAVFDAGVLVSPKGPPLRAEELAYGGAASSRRSSGTNLSAVSVASSGGDGSWLEGREFNREFGNLHEILKLITGSGATFPDGDAAIVAFDEAASTRGGRLNTALMELIAKYNSSDAGRVSPFVYSIRTEAVDGSGAKFNEETVVEPIKGFLKGAYDRLRLAVPSYLESAGKKTGRVAASPPKALGSSMMGSVAGSSPTYDRVSPEAAARSAPMAGGGGGEVRAPVGLSAHRAPPPAPLGLGIGGSRLSATDEIYGGLSAQLGNVHELLKRCEMNLTWVDRNKALVQFDNDAFGYGGLSSAIAMLAEKYNATLVGKTSRFVSSFTDPTIGIHRTSPEMALRDIKNILRGAYTSTGTMPPPRLSSSTYGTGASAGSLLASGYVHSGSTGALSATASYGARLSGGGSGGYGHGGHHHSTGGGRW